MQHKYDAFTFHFATYFAVDIVMLCYFMLCYVILCYVMLCYVMLFFSSVDKGPIPHIYRPHPLRDFHDRAPLGKKLQSLVAGYEEHVIENK